VLPAILLSGLVCLWLLLRDPSFDRRELWRAAAERTHGRPLLARTAILCAIIAAIMALWRPADFFALCRNHPQVWLAILVLYPPLSVYPQELVFRTFFFHRYGRLFRTPAARVVASAAAFGYAHILLHSALVMALTALGGLLFATTYQRTRSLFLVTLEHAVYGCWLLTVGFGAHFQNALRLLTRSS